MVQGFKVKIARMINFKVIPPKLLGPVSYVQTSIFLNLPLLHYI